MKKKLVILLIAIIVIILILIGMCFSYSKSDAYSSEKFNTNYIINGVDCSGLTYSEAADKLPAEYNKQTLTIKSGNETLANLSNFGCTYQLSNDLPKVKKQNILKSAINYYLTLKVSVSMPMNVTSTSDAFKEQVTNLEFLNQNELIKKSQDAYVDTSDEAFPIIEAQTGNEIDKEKFYKHVISHIRDASLTLDYSEDNYYKEPSVFADDKNLLDYQKFCQKYLTQKITYELGNDTFTVPTEDLATLYTKDCTGSADSDGIKKYVKELASKYDNVGITRSFKTLAGKEVTITGGTYGWQIDQKEECIQLTKDIESHKDVSREPIFSNTGYTKYQDGIGKTYIDVDLTKQEVHLYIDGEDKFNCKVVTGCKADGKATPEGTWYVKNKLRNVTMRGSNVDGSRYEVPAMYWMGITPNGIGLHDSNWRTEFGGDIWKTNGSHGCINMPKWLIGDMYEQVEINMPVITHY